MGEPLPKQVLDTAVSPDAILQQSFDLARRGFDQRQVQAYLRAVADSLQDAQKREAEMRTRLGRAVRRAETAERVLRNAPAHDPAELDRQFADQVASILDAARIAAEQRSIAAEKSAAKIMASAKTEATRMRAEADAILSERQSEAEVAATDIVGEGKSEAQTLRDQARVEAEAMLAHAADRVQRARDECDGLIREAEEARAQILEDMERRRRQARAQVERLRVGRDRLLRSYEVVRRTLEETTVELKSSLKEAKVRGDGAARAITSEPLATREQLEAELRDAKMIGRIAITDPGATQPGADTSASKPALRSPALPRPLSPATDGGTVDPPRRLRVSDAMKKGAASKQPKAPAVAPSLRATPASAGDQSVKDPIAAMIEAAEAKRGDTAAPVSPDLDESEFVEGTAGGSVDELIQLEDDDLDVVELADEIEEVVALPLDAPEDAAANDAASHGASSGDSALGLFAALRSQRSKKQRAKKSDSNKQDLAASSKLATPATDKDSPDDKTAESKTPGKTTAGSTTAESKPVETAAANEPVETSEPNGARVVAPGDLPGLEAQRDAVVADAAKQLEKRLKRALADEQNELLAGIRAAKRKRVALTAIVGDVDDHVNRYVRAIHEVAAVTYGAGAALLDAEALEGHLPAGAVEELLALEVVLPIRERLASLDELDVELVDQHLDPVRDFYRQRKTDHLGFAASRLASLLCVAGLCDALPDQHPVPWAPPMASPTAP